MTQVDSGCNPGLGHNHPDTCRLKEMREPP